MSRQLIGALNEVARKEKARFLVFGSWKGDLAGIDHVTHSGRARTDDVAKEGFGEGPSLDKEDLPRGSDKPGHPGRGGGRREHRSVPPQRKPIPAIHRGMTISVLQRSANIRFGMTRSVQPVDFVILSLTNPLTKDHP